MSGGASEISKSFLLFEMELYDFFIQYDSSNYSAYKSIKIVI